MQNGKLIQGYRQKAKVLAIFFTSDVITINFFLVAFKCAQNLLFSIQRECEQIYENKNGIKHSDLKKGMHPLECSK